MRPVQRCSTSAAAGPLMRITDMAPEPGGVAMAAMVSLLFIGMHHSLTDGGILQLLLCKMHKFLAHLNN
jgi:hypothetical protein